MNETRYQHDALSGTTWESIGGELNPWYQDPATLHDWQEIYDLGYQLANRVPWLSVEQALLLTHLTYKALPAVLTYRTTSAREVGGLRAKVTRTVGLIQRLSAPAPGQEPFLGQIQLYDPEGHHAMYLDKLVDVASPETVTWTAPYPEPFTLNALSHNEKKAE